MADKFGNEEPSSIGLKSKGSGFVYAITAGLFAALAAVFAKISLNENQIREYICSDRLVNPSGLRPYFQWLISFLNSTHSAGLNLYFGPVFSCENISLVLRAVGVIMIFVSNAVMFRSFSKSLLLCSSTAEATTANTAANFCFSAFFGWVLFGERFSINWYFGTSLIIMGLALINKNRSNSNAVDDKE